MTPPLSLEDAQARLLELVEPLGRETVPTVDAAGRWLLAPLIASRASPAADLSSMDGFAVAGEGPWRVVGESAAGRPYDGALSAGQATHVSTGAHMPRGAEAVLIKEHARTEAQLATSDGGKPTADWIRRAGFDFAAGEVLLSVGHPIGPAQVALALAAGRDRLEVGRLPSVAIIDTGDELAACGAALGAAMIPATNGAMLAALCRPLAGAVNAIGPVADDPAQLWTALESAAGADVIVTSGGASVGDHDHLRPVLEEWGARAAFWRVAIRPGKPIVVAHRGSQVIVGLPGNPVSAYVTAILFVLPLLRRLAGAHFENALPRSMPALLAATIPPGGERREFLRARWTWSGVSPLPERDSSAIKTMAWADALIDRPANAPTLDAGEVVRVISLGNGGMA